MGVKKLKFGLINNYFLFIAFHSFKMSPVTSIEICLKSDAKEITVIYNHGPGLKVKFGATSVDEMMSEIGECYNFGMSVFDEEEFPCFPMAFKDLFVQIYERGVKIILVLDGVPEYFIHENGRPVPCVETLTGKLFPKAIKVSTTLPCDASYIVFYGICGEEHVEDSAYELCPELDSKSRAKMYDAFQFNDIPADRKTITEAFRETYGADVKVSFVGPKQEAYDITN